MGLYDNPDRQGRNLRRRGVNQTQKHWSDAQKIEAVTLWLSMGNLRLVAATLRIPEDTMRRWRATQWWKEIADEIAVQDKIQLSATAKNIIDKSLTVIADRLEQGDWIYDQKSGQMRRKPVNMKDALAVADRLMDRKEKLDRLETTHSTAESVEAKLNKLMEKFSQVAAGAPPAQPVTDIIFVPEGTQEEASAEDEEGPERPDGSGLLLRQGVSEETGTGEEPGGEECSTEDDE